MKCKLTEVCVEKLFGAFDHKIAFKKDGITIIIGENGIGKTVLLEMISSVFKEEFHFLMTIEFEKLSFGFSNGKKFTIDKKKFFHLNHNSKKRTSKDEYIFQHSLFFEEDDYIESSNELYLARQIARRNVNLKQIGPRTWFDLNKGVELSYRKVISNFSKQKIINKELPNWFKEIINEKKVSLIETQRLLSITDKYPRKTVEVYSDNIRSIINTKLAESTEESSRLDRTFPDRLIRKLSNIDEITNDELQDKFEELEKRRKILSKVGLIKIDEESFLKERHSFQDDSTLNKVLALYIQDSFSKLIVFDDLSKKIEIFLKIINKRFKHKKLLIDKEEGFLQQSTIIKDDKGQDAKIPIKKLSSGEQNELILFYRLLFYTDKNSLILIDEPEISLHVSWQNSFINDIKQIAEINNLDVLIATHSPDIIGNNWDMKIRLEGVE